MSAGLEKGQLRHQHAAFGRLQKLVGEDAEAAGVQGLVGRPAVVQAGRGHKQEARPHLLGLVGKFEAAATVRKTDFVERLSVELLGWAVRGAAHRENVEVP